MRHNLPSYTCARTCVLAFALALSACDDVEKAIDCIDDDRPQFSTYELPNPVLNEAYNERITASISNTPDDNDFDYSFTLDGDLPTGISFRADGRTVFFEGAATEPGTWMPTLNVLVSDGGGAFGDGADADTLCRTTRTETYVLVVSDL
jgi:hypothetical protein